MSAGAGVDIATLGLEVRSDGVVVATDRLKDLKRAGQDAGEQAGSLSKTFDSLGYSLKSLQTMITNVVGALALMKLASIAQEAIMLTARYDTLGVVMVAVGKNAVYASSQMASFQASLQKMGISATEARNSLIKMAGAQMDLTKADKLARVAQDAAVIGGINSSEAFGRMIQGIRSGEVEILKTIGINVQFEQGYQKTAEALGKTTKELTSTEKTMSRMNEVLSFGKNIAGAYEASMGTVGKQLTSLPRYIQDLMIKIGEFGQGALFVGISTLTQGLKWLTTNFDDVASAVGTFAKIMALVGFGRFAAQVYEWNAAMRMSIAHTEALKINTIFNAQATASSAAATVAETQAKVTNNLATLEAIAAARAEAVAQLQVTTSTQGRAIVIREIAALGVQQASVNAALTLSTEELALATASAAAADAALATAQASATVTASAMAGVMSGLSIAMSLVGGVIGAIAIGIAAVTYAIIKFMNRAEEAQNKLAALNNQGDMAQMIQKLNEIERLNKQLEDQKKPTAEVAKSNEIKTQEEINKKIKENISLRVKLADMPKKTAGDTLTGTLTEWDKVNAKIKDNENYIKHGMTVTKEMNEALAKQDALRKAANPTKETGGDNSLAEKQAAYDKQLRDALAATEHQYDENRKKEEEANMKVRLGQLQFEKEMGIKTVQEYLDAKYKLEKDTLSKELADAKATASERYKDYSKASDDPGADRLMQTKAEKDWAKALGDSAAIQEKLNAVEAARPRDTSKNEETLRQIAGEVQVQTLQAQGRSAEAIAAQNALKYIELKKKDYTDSQIAQIKLNDALAAQNALYDKQLATRQQLNGITEGNTSFAASQVGTNSVGEVTDPLANQLAIEADAHQIRLTRITEMQTAAQVAFERGKLDAQELAALQLALEKKVANEKIANAQKTAKIQSDASKSYYSNTLAYASKNVPALGALDKVIQVAHTNYEVKKADGTKDTTRSMLSMYSAYGTAAAGVFSALADSQDQNSRKGFETAKAFNIAAAIVSTAAGIMSAFSAPDNVTMVQKIAMAALVGVTGALQIAKIASTSFGGGGSAPNIPAGSFSGGAGGGAGAVGNSIGNMYTSTDNNLSLDQMKSIAGSMKDASRALMKVADGLTKVSDLFTSGSFLSLLGGSLATGANTESAGGWQWKSAIGNSLGISQLVALKNALTDAGSATLNMLSGKGSIGDWFSNMGNVAVDFSKTIIQGAADFLTLGFGGSVFGGSKSKEAEGIQLAVKNGMISASNYMTIKTDGGWFSSDKHSTTTQYNAGASASMQAGLNQIIGTINRAAAVMGTSVDTSKVNVAASNISTAGRSATDINKDIQAYLVTASNELSKNVIGLKDFAFYGENAFDAIVRLSTSLQSFNDAMVLVGHSTQASTLAGANLSYKIIEMMGGAEKFTEAIDTYFKSVFTDQEQKTRKAAEAQNKLQVTFAAISMNTGLNVAIPKTRIEFQNLVNSLDLTTERGAQTFASLISVSEAFGLTMEAIDDLNTALTSMAETSMTYTLNKLQEAMDATAKLLDASIGQALSATDALLALKTQASSPETAYQNTKQAFLNAVNSKDNEQIMALQSQLLSTSKTYNASGVGYQTDLAIVTKALTDLSQISIDDPTLTELQSHKTYLQNMKDSLADQTKLQGTSADSLKDIKTLWETWILNQTTSKTVAQAAFDTKVSGLSGVLTTLRNSGDMAALAGGLRTIAGNAPDTSANPFSSGVADNLALLADKINSGQGSAQDKATLQNTINDGIQKYLQTTIDALKNLGVTALAPTLNSISSLANGQIPITTNANAFIQLKNLVAQAILPTAANPPWSGTWKYADGSMRKTMVNSGPGYGPADSYENLIAYAKQWHIAGYAVGTPYVPKDMLANIHQGEIIIDRSSSDVLRKYGVPTQGAADNRGVEERLDKVVKSLEAMEKKMTTLETNSRLAANA